MGSVLLAQGQFDAARATFPTTDAAAFSGRFTTRISALLLIGISHQREGNSDLALEVYQEAGAACRTWSPPDLLGRIKLETGVATASIGKTVAAEDIFNEVAKLLQANDRTSTEELAYFNGDLKRDLVEAYVSLPNIDSEASLNFARKVLSQWQSVTSGPDGKLASPQIIFFLGEKVSGRWTVNEHKTQWLELPAEKEIVSQVAPVVADMATPGRPVPEAELQQLVNTLLPGILEGWSSGTTLAIVPDLAMFRIPWAALPLPDGMGVMIDHGPFVVLDAPTEKLNSQSHHGAEGKLLAVGTDGLMGDSSGKLETLRFAEAEARSLAKLWPANQATLMIGDSAGRGLTDHCGLSEYEAIHVASHATVLQGVSNDPVLILAGENAETPSTTSINKLDLDAHLVFLSCCESGYGRGSRGGNSGLAQSFLDAGARNVVASLIVIDDEAARVLTAHFYDHWLAGLSVPEALSAAQNNLRADGSQWSHPFFWAFYQVMVGESSGS